MYSRAAYIGAWPACIIAVIAVRLLGRIISPACVGGERRPLSWEAGNSGMFCAATSQQSLVGLKIIAMFDDDPSPYSPIPGIPVLGPLSAARDFAEKHGISYCVIAMPNLHGRSLASAIESHGHYFRHLLIIPDLFGVSSLWVHAKDLGGILGLEVNQVLLRCWPRMLKRTVEFVATALAMIPLTVLFALIALIVKLTSPGPVFYRHPRYGKNGRIFKAWKFRSMYINGK